MSYFRYNTFASTYGSGSYNSSTYNGAATGSSTSSGGSSSSSSTLTNTGIDIATGVTLACVIIFVALVVKFWKKPKSKQ
jgi:hypothetical protein